MGSFGYRILKLALLILLALVILFLFVLPLLTSFMVTQSSGALPSGLMKYLRQIETIQSWLLQGVTAIWLVFFGGCFASFLNVVAWRVPRGRSILGTSACPNCEQRLGFRDNLPIVGWLRNGGQCSNCANPINVRYLVVELILGFLFLGFVLVQLVSGGFNLPGFESQSSVGGFERVLFDPKWPLIRITAYHLTLISMLFTFALIRMEKSRIPVSVFSFFIAIAVIAGLIATDLHPVAWSDAGVDQPDRAAQFSVNAITVVFGAIAGIVFGATFWKLYGDPQPEKSGESIDIAMAMVLTGIFLGWQGLVATLVLFALMQGAVRGLRLRRPVELFGNPIAVLLVASLIHLVAWRSIAGCFFLPGHTASLPVQLLWCAVVIGLFVLLRFMSGFSADKEIESGSDVNLDKPRI